MKTTDILIDRIHDKIVVVNKKNGEILHRIPDKEPVPTTLPPDIYAEVCKYRPIPKGWESV